MVNSCGIEFSSDDSEQDSPVVSRDTLKCMVNNKTSMSQETVNYFKAGSLSVRGDKSVVKLQINGLEGHTDVRIVMDIMFILPNSILDAIFKAYYDGTSGYFFTTDCGFFTSNK
jgi:hypothetical protein